MKWIILVVVGFAVVAGGVYVGIRLADDRKEQAAREQRREEIERKLARDNLAMIGKALSQYYEKNKAAPPDLASLVASGELPALSLTCPLKGYRYVFIGYVHGSNRIAVYELATDGNVHDALTADGSVWPATKDEIAEGSIGVTATDPSAHSIFDGKPSDVGKTIDAPPVPLHEYHKTLAGEYRSREEGPTSYQEKPDTTLRDAQVAFEQARREAETSLATDPAYLKAKADVADTAEKRETAIARFGRGSAEVLDASSKWVAALERLKAIVGKNQSVHVAQRNLDAARQSPTK